MSDEQTPKNTPDGTDGSEPKVFDEAYVKKLREENARYRTEAKANADAAKRLADIEDSQKTVEQKNADRIAKLEADLEAARSESVRARIQAKYGISDEDAELFLTYKDPEKLEAQARALAERSSAQKDRGLVIPHQRTHLPDLKNDPLRELAQQVFNT